MIPALQSLLEKVAVANLEFDDDPDAVTKFQRLLINQFPDKFLPSASSDSNSKNIMQIEGLDAEGNILETSPMGPNTMLPSQRQKTAMDYESDCDDEDGPVVVGMEEVQASLERSSDYKNPRNDIPLGIQNRYPLLIAGIQNHEDILMTCARALDEKKDVSLVREAAAYLEETERRKLY